MNIVNKYLQVMGKTMVKPLKGRRLAFKPTQLQHRCAAVSNSARWAAASSERSGLGSSLWGRRFRPANDAVTAAFQGIPCQRQWELEIEPLDSANQNGDVILL